ncbi:MAG: CRISPR-associated protein Csy2 family [Proteobacteria bacterium]|nr:CRISPR-associated protein Csy2 family [Pseudomonadota bacterium]
MPIPVGYGALSGLYPPGAVANARDATTPFRFVESLYSIGEWLAPHRLQSPQQLLWYADTDVEAGHYRVRNDYAAALKPVAESLSESTSTN